ncbi:hypothetical protein [Prolixibacter sp. NT017]|uniref:spermine/spermidine synthase domain-containing protein n=1 Tax=Prolixibacter sp. NT017 TaxID=2652390 RepID=UPI0012858C72|nr:hypothetical protein [Prolixibacter sp. NT017]GET24245.1 hypothetical protein NT017_05740 [Prolixibacter sp. NT017]
MNTPYSIIPILSGTLLAYFITWILSRQKWISRNVHRQIWNTLLLITFLFTIVLGLLLALKANYNLKFAFLDEALPVHVDFGIAMSIIGLLHIFWHLNYFKRLFGKETEPKSTETSEEKQVDIRKTPLLFPFILGFVTLTGQLVLFRDYLAIFGGNALYVGILLSLWLILTGVGTQLARDKAFSVTKIIRMLLMLTVLPSISILIIRITHGWLFETGTETGPLSFAFFALFTLAPLCLTGGLVFPVLSQHRPGETTGLIYSWESAGSLLAGMLFSFVWVFLISPIQTVALTGIISLALLLFLRRRMKEIPLYTTSAITILLVFLAIFPPEKSTRASLFPGQQIQSIIQSISGELVITKAESQSNVFENSRLLYSQGSPSAAEEPVHYALSQLAHVNQIAVVSGALTGVLTECLKYHPNRIDYFEVNGKLLELEQQSHAIPNDSLIHIHRTDFQRWIAQHPAQYDGVLLNIPPPETPSASRFYSKEFFRSIRKKLSDSGVVAIPLLSTANYLDPTTVRLYQSVVATIQPYFKHWLILPGNRDILLVSNGKLHANILTRVNDLGIMTNYIAYFVDESELVTRSHEYAEMMTNGAPMVWANHPIAVSYFTGFWLKKHGLSYILFGTILFVIFIFLISFTRGISRSMFAAGFTASTMEIIPLILIQSAFGYSYYLIGVIFTLFMAGLTLGARWKIAEGPKSNDRIYRQHIWFMVLLILQWAIAGWLSPGRTVIYIASELLLIALTGWLTGRMFQLISRQYQPKTEAPAMVYKADLYGSAGGAMLVSVFLVPLLGINLTLIVLLMMHLLLTFVSKHRTSSVST